MLFAPMDFSHITIDALIDSRALVKCLPKAEFDRLKQLSPQDILREAGPPEFKLQVANGNLEQPLSTVYLQFEIGD